jgi:hypothetical protein
MRKCGKIERVYHGWGRPFGGGSGDWRGGDGALERVWYCGSFYGCGFKKAV